MVEMAINFNLGVDEGDTEELLKVVHEEMTNEELLDLKQEHITEEEARGKEMVEEKEDPSPKKIHSEWFSRSVCRC